jgi:hypothetical protein
LLSEGPDWEQVRQEEEQARLANDRARSAARPGKRRYPGGGIIPDGELFPGAAFPDGPIPVPATFPNSSPLN